MTLTHLSLFSGIGGIDLAAEWAGFETVAFCEQNKFCQQVLGKHWPGVPIYDDVRTLTIETLGRADIDLMSGGFPCQDVSLAGERAGLKGKRSTLWSEFYRLICEIKPKWVLVENVYGLLSSDDGRFFGNILRDLAETRYYAQWQLLSASAVGAPHQRERMFILAHPNCNGLEKNSIDAILRMGTLKDRFIRHAAATSSQGMWQGKVPNKSSFCGMDDGLPRRVDRLRALGDSVVPQQVYPILKAIADYELQGQIA